MKISAIDYPSKFSNPCKLTVLTPRKVKQRKARLKEKSDNVSLIIKNENNSKMQKNSILKEKRKDEVRSVFG